MAIGTDLLFSDNFERVNGALGSDWSTDTIGTNIVTWEVSGNQATAVITGGTSGEINWANVQTFSADNANYKVVGDLVDANSGRTGFLVRRSGVGSAINGYMVYRNGLNTLVVDRIVGGVATNLLSQYNEESLGNTTWTIEIEDTAGDPSIRISTVASGLIATVVDTSVDKITAIGDVGFVFRNSASNGNIYGWDNIQVFGTGGTPVADIDFYTSGNISNNSATVVTRSSSGDPIKLEYSVNSDFSASVETLNQTPVAGNDFILKFDLTGLASDTKYYFRAVQNNSVTALKTGSLRTGRAKGTPFSFSYAFSSCAATNSVSDVFGRIASKDPQFFLQGGDIHYSDITVNNVDLYRTAYKNVFGSEIQSLLYGKVGLMHMWDDHDYSSNNSGASAVSKPAAQATYREYFAQPTELPNGAIYYSKTIGRVKFIVPDLRSERAGTELMSTTQQTWLESELTDAANDSDIQVVVVFMSVPWIAGSVGNSNDTWAEATAQRTAIADHIYSVGLQDSIVFTSGDMHAVAYDDGTNNTFDTLGRIGWPVYQSAAMDQTGSVKGGPYSFAASSGGGRYTTMDINDAGGSTITLTTKGYDETDSLIYTHVYPIASLSVNTVTPSDPITFGTNTHTTTITPTSGKIISGTSEVALTSVTATQGTLPAPADLAPAVLFGTVTYSLTDGTETVTDATNLVPAAGTSVVTVTAGYATDATSWLKDFAVAPEAGDQAIYPDGIVLNGDGSWNGVAGTYNCFYIKASNAQQQYEAFTLTVAADTTADAFTFVDLTGQSRSVQVESNAITVTGVSANTDIPITVTGGEYSVSTDSGSTWGAFTNLAGNVRLNDQVKVRHTTSGNYATQVDTLLNLNGVADTFSTTTIAGDVTAPILSAPAAFSTGENTASGSVSTNEANGTLFYVATANATESVATVKAGASKAISSTGTQNVSVSGLTQGSSYYLHFVHTDAAGNDSGRVSSAQFTTDAAITSPTMPVDASVNVDEHTTLVGTFTASSGTAPFTYALSGTDASLFNINASTGVVNFVSAPNFEKDAQSYAITVTATNSNGSDTQNITVNVQDVAEDHTPNVFTFTDYIDVPQSTAIESDAITVLGVKAGEPIPISITNGQYAVSTDGGITFGGWTSAASNVELNYVVKVRQTSAATKNTQTSTVLTIGGVSDTFSTTTVLDLIAPVITLTGQSEYTLLVGDSWVEPGYSALDDTDGNLTASVVIGGDTVDTATAGTYAITYNVQDLEGNSADQVVRTVSVVAPGIADITGTVTAGASFDVSLVGVAALTAGEQWQALIKVAGKYYPTTIDNVTDTVISMTASNDLPPAALGNAELILQKTQEI